MTDRNFPATIAEYISACAEMPAGPDQSKDWAALERRFPDANQGKAFITQLREFLREIKLRMMHSGFARKHSPEIVVDDLQIEPGNKGGFVRIVKQHRDYDGNVTGQRMSVAFVSMADAPATKALCARKLGDVFKCATYKAPATHVRGSIFSDTNGAESLTDDGHVRGRRPRKCWSHGAN